MWFGKISSPFIWKTKLNISYGVNSFDPTVKASYYVCGAYGSSKRIKKVKFLNTLSSLVSNNDL